MNVCDRCEQGTKVIGKGFDWEFPIARDLFEFEDMVLCRDCCIETKTVPEGYAFSRNCLSGNDIMIPAEDKGKPHLDPAYERYHCM